MEGSYAVASLLGSITADLIRNVTFAAYFVAQGNLILSLDISELDLEQYYALGPSMRPS